MAVRPRGLIWFSPECKTWLSFLSRRTHSRLVHGVNILGASSPVVDKANTCSLVLAWLVVLSHTRGVKYAVEQPLNSLLFCTPWLSDSIQLARGHRFTTSLQMFGGSSLKILEIYTNLSEPITKRFLVKKGKRCNARSTLTVTKSGWTTGNHKQLRASAAYPDKFCDAIVAAMKSSLS